MNHPIDREALEGLAKGVYRRDAGNILARAVLHLLDNKQDRKWVPAPEVMQKMNDAADADLDALDGAEVWRKMRTILSDFADQVDTNPEATGDAIRDIIAVVKEAVKK
jgi:hypothetical protein